MSTCGEYHGRGCGLRRTGRTTAIAIKAIGEAMASPGRHIVLEDHHRDTPEGRRHFPNTFPNTERTWSFLEARVRELLAGMQLVGFSIDRRRRTLTYTGIPRR